MPAFPNPARGSLAIGFSNVNDEFALPDLLELVSEKQIKVEMSVDVKTVFRQNAFKNSNQLVLDISKLPRGVYYMRVTNLRLPVANRLETTRLLFE